jgi:hypothetical protein
VTLEGYRIDKGIARETKETRQKNIKYFTGLDGTRSGKNIAIEDRIVSE